MQTPSSSLWHLSASEENLKRQKAPPVDRQNWEGYLIPKSPSYIAAINASEGKMAGIRAGNLDEIPLTRPENGESDTADGVGLVREGKKTDFVLVYVKGKAEGDEDKKKENKEKEQKREEFENNLEQCGLQLQRIESTGNEEEIRTFVLVHAPWNVLAKHAEEMMIRCPVRESEETTETPKGMKAYLSCASKVYSVFQVPERMESLHRKKITAFFNRDKMSSFLNIEDKESFFSDPDRIRIVNRLLKSARYSSEKQEDFGIARLLYDSVYSDAYPMHDGPTEIEAEEEPKCLRQQLHSEWASFSRWYKTQPLNAIKHYLGIRVAFYFAWLGIYNFMLLFAAFTGLWCFVGGLVTIKDFVPTKEICDEGNSALFYMCPLCDKDCSFWTLTTSCTYSTITRLFDHNGTVFFAIFMSFWATIFLEVWRRKEIKLAHEWDMMSYEDEFQPPRPAFVAKAKKSRLNPVTGKPEPYVPLVTRVGRYTCAMITLAFMILLVIGALVGVVIYRAAMVAVLFAHPDENVQQSARLFTSLTASVINLVAITVLGFLYEWLAKTLTDWENPRTMTDYQDMMTMKLFLFQSVNNYSSLFYIAFFKGSSVIGYPGNFNRVNGGRLEGCDPSGCLIELCIQLAVIMVGKQFISSIQKFAVPSLTKWWVTRSADKRQSSTQWERDYMLNEEPEMRMFYEYHDMVIQFGFVTLFVAAFPLAPLFALINNIVELRIDAINFVVNFRRPVPQRARGIGAWFEILRVMSRVAVLVNTFVIAFTSEFIPRLVYQYSYSPDGSLKGYVDNSLSYFNVSDFRSRSLPDEPFKNLPYNQSFCRYKEYFEPVKPYRYSRQHYVVLAARLTFVIVFQYFVFVIVGFLDWLIPDVPRALDIKIKRENYIARECMSRSEADASRDYETRTSRRGGSVDTLYMSCEAIPRARGGNVSSSRVNENQV